MVCRPDIHVLFMRCCRYGIPVVVIHIPFVLLYVTVQLHRCPAAMPHVVSRLSLLLCCASLSLCVCFHSCCWVCSCISTSVSNVEMNQVPDKDMPTCANTQRHPTRPVMCNGMIIIIDHFITMTPLDLSPSVQHSPVPSAHTHNNIASPIPRRPQTCLGSAAAATAQRRRRFFASVFEIDRP